MKVYLLPIFVVGSERFQFEHDARKWVDWYGGRVECRIIECAVVDEQVVVPENVRSSFWWPNRYQ